MIMKRIDIQLAIPMEVFDEIPVARKKAFRDEVRAMKKLAVRINEGLDNEEITVIANIHDCHHNELGNTISCNDTLVEI